MAPSVNRVGKRGSRVIPSTRCSDIDISQLFASIHISTVKHHVFQLSYLFRHHAELVDEEHVDADLEHNNDVDDYLHFMR